MVETRYMILCCMCLKIDICILYSGSLHSELMLFNLDMSLSNDRKGKGSRILICDTPIRLGQYHFH